MLIITGSYVLLIAALIVGITLARYQDAKVAYASFGAANFNALILGENTIEGMTDEENPVINKFGVNLQTTNYRPGMKWNEDPEQNTAETLPFSVTNGTTDANSSQVSLDYSVRLRTSGNLPLKYVLALWIPDEMEPCGGHYNYYAAGESRVITDSEESAGTWYEYSFYPEDTADSGDELPPEALFDLDGGSLQLHSHRLIIEWPVTDGGENGPDTNSPIYMKEVELIEILVTVSSKNMLDEQGYLDTEIPATAPYSVGLVILDPDKGITVEGSGPSEACSEFMYKIDYRSFSQDGATARSFMFNVENGIGKGSEQSSVYTIYDLLLKLPVNEYTGAFHYTLYAQGSDEGVELGTPMEYRLYNELDETYEVCPTADYPEGKSEPQYRMYAIYSLASDQTIVNKINNPSGEGQIYYADSDTFKLSITKPDASQIFAYELEDICFDNKIEVLVEAEFTDVPLQQN